MPWGSTQDPVLLNILITDLVVECPLSKLAGDRKPGGDAAMPEECAAIQRDLEG